MTAKGMTVLYSGCIFYITVLNFCNAGVHLANHHRDGELADVPVEIVHIRDKLYSNTCSVQAHYSDCYFSTVHYKHATDCLKQMTEDEDVRERDSKSLENNWSEDVQLPAKTEQYRF